jgi:hypothetical protein
MSSLLQTLAERDTLHLAGLMATFEEESGDLSSLPLSKRFRKTTTAARVLTQKAVGAAEIIEDWSNLVTESLKEGMNGNDFRIQVRSGSLLMQACLEIVESASRMWERVAELTAPNPNEFAEDREKVAAARERMLTVKPWLDRLAKLAEAQLPDVDPSQMESGEEQMRQGRFKTGEELMNSTIPKSESDSPWRSSIMSRRRWLNRSSRGTA